MLCQDGDEIDKKAAIVKSKLDVLAVHQESTKKFIDKKKALLES